MRTAALVVVGLWVGAGALALGQASGSVAGTVAQKSTAAAPVAPAAAPGVTPAAHVARAPDVVVPPTADDKLRGAYGPYRANNDLLSYDLHLRVDPVAKSIAGSNVVRFKMLAAGSKIQLELTPALAIDSMTMDGKALQYEREERTLWITLPRTLAVGEVAAVTIAYSGKPVTQGRFGCFSFDKDKAGRPWITTACEGDGASIWWPNKDQWRDEPQDGVTIAVAVPNGMIDVSNGRFVGSRDLGDGYTEWTWQVHYPINNYDVALNIGDYTHFGGVHKNKETGETTTLDYYVLPEDLEKAKVQFAQVPEMMDAYEHYFGEYPFDKDGYKLVEVPYSGMEHQSAVSYGNHFENGYLGRDWTGVGISPKFDFIIIHESGHEWFGNAVSAADRSDMWIHEGWTTYMETLYVEYRFGKADGILYLNGFRPKVHNERPIVPARGVNADPPQDQYFKGALMLNTLRTVVNDDAKWFADLHDFYQHFKYQNIMTEDVVTWWSARTGMDLKPFFDEYLRHAALPMLELSWDNSRPGFVKYRWKADEAGFSMPIRVGDPAHWTMVTPNTKAWQEMAWPVQHGPGQDLHDDFKVDSEHYYVAVDRLYSLH